MKIRTIASILILVSISFMIINGCATTARVKEPGSPHSTLLIGRVRVFVMGFPGDFKVVNGEYTDRVQVYLVNASTEEIIEVKSHGKFGLFYISDIEPGPYVIAGFEKYIKKERARVGLGYSIQDYPYFFITDGSVNNLGDISWHTKFVERTHGAKRVNLETYDWHVFKMNYNRVENWFTGTYPKSAWADMKWINVEIMTNK